MPLLNVSYEVYEDEDLLQAVFFYLWKEHNAKISIPSFQSNLVRFSVKGSGLPKGCLNITVKELVPKVLIISVE